MCQVRQADKICMLLLNKDILKIKHKTNINFFR